MVTAWKMMAASTPSRRIRFLRPTPSSSAMASEATRHEAPRSRMVGPSQNQALGWVMVNVPKDSVSPKCHDTMATRAATGASTTTTAGKVDETAPGR
jgi:hypothetical protein